MYAHLLILLNANNEKRADTPVGASATPAVNPSHVDFNRYEAEGVYNRPFKDIPREALVAYNRRFGLPDTHGLPETLAATAARARAAQEQPIQYTDNRGLGNRVTSNLTDYWDRYANNWNVAFGGNDSYAHEGDDWTRTAGQWANRIGFDALTTAATLGAGSALAPALRTGVGAAGRVASGVASRAVPLGARAAGAARTAADTGLWAVDLGLYGTLRGAQFLGNRGTQLLGNTARGVYSAATNPRTWPSLAANASRKGLTYVLQGVQDFALPTSRILTEGLKGRGLGDNVMRVGGSLLGAYNLHNTAKNTLVDYQATGNLSDALSQGAVNHLASIPLSPLGPVEELAGNMVGPVGQQALQSSAVAAIIEEQKNKGILGAGGVTKLEQALNSNNPAERQIAIDMVNAKIKEMHPYGVMANRTASTFVNFNPITFNHKDLRDHNMNLKAISAVENALSSGQGAESVVTGANQALKERGLDPAQYPTAPLGFYIRYLESELAKAQSDEYSMANTPKIIAALQELQRLKANAGSIQHPAAVQQAIQESMRRLNPVYATTPSENSITPPDTIPSSSLSRSN